MRIQSCTQLVMINMNSISAMEKEIGYKVEDLPKFSLPKQANVDECLIMGSGDSYVAHTHHTVSFGL